MLKGSILHVQTTSVLHTLTAPLPKLHIVPVILHISAHLLQSTHNLHCCQWFFQGGHSFCECVSFYQAVSLFGLEINLHLKCAYIVLSLRCNAGISADWFDKCSGFLYNRDTFEKINTDMIFTQLKLSGWVPPRRNQWRLVSSKVYKKQRATKSSVYNGNV